MSASPTARSLDRCRKEGWLAAVVEKWIPQTRRRLDLFGFGDLVALDGQPGCLMIQATSTGNAADRVAKIVGPCEENARAWLEAGNRIEVWGWAKRSRPGWKRKVWTLRRYRIWLEGDEFKHEGENA